MNAINGSHYWTPLIDAINGCMYMSVKYVSNAIKYIINDSIDDSINVNFINDSINVNLH